MPECNHCDAAFETDEELAAHLVESHEWDDLSAIDRRLVETYQPAGTPDATMSAKLARAVGSVPGANRFNRRQVLALFAGAVALSGTGAVVNWWSNADDIDTESLTGVWEHGPELPISAEYPAVTAYDDQLYVLGGGRRRPELTVGGISVRPSNGVVVGISFDARRGPTDVRKCRRR